MGTKTIGLDDEAYERLAALKRESESFSDAVKRLTDEVASDWRAGFGKYDGDEGERLAAAARASRRDSASLAARGDEALSIVAGDDEDASGPEA